MVPSFNCVALQASFLTVGMMAGCKPDTLYELWGQGALELHDALCQYAETISTLNEALSEHYAFPGVFEYEVTEELGAWFGCVLEREGDMPSSPRVHGQLALLATRFMARGGCAEAALPLIMQQLSLEASAIECLPQAAAGC